MSFGSFYFKFGSGDIQYKVSYFYLNFTIRFIEIIPALSKQRNEPTDANTNIRCGKIQTTYSFCQKISRINNLLTGFRCALSFFTKLGIQIYKFLNLPESTRKLEFNCAASLPN